ncbi:MAG: esterase [Archangium gephyra]|uniref:Esterase n=1 Tax=Archangium gephyra TaxID=48 RepID=A0A2W5V519_9BACT|nr:MAG: esterase [Archangium gephyra]
MKHLALLIFLAGCGSVAPFPDSGVVGDSGVVSVEDAGVQPDAGTSLTTTLVVKYPAGTHTLYVRGNKLPLNWNSGIAMTKVSADTWTLSLPTLTSDLEWKPLLDDTTWSRGPNWTAKLHQRVEVAPRFTRDEGEWSVRWPNFPSTVLGNSRGISVYLPPTYLENAAARMPVVYMHDGQNLFDASTAFGGVTWRVPETMNAAANDGRFREAIVIGVDNTGSSRIDEYTPTADPMYGGGKGELYLRFLVEELKPRVDSELRTKTGREDTVLIGSSLGGLISSYAGVKRADVFANIGAMSPSVWWNGRVLLTLVSQSPSSRPTRVYVDSGDSGPSNDGVVDTRELVSTYRALGYTDGLKHVEQAGATHTEAAWASRLPGALEFLLGPR